MTDEENSFSFAHSQNREDGADTTPAHAAAPTETPIEPEDTVFSTPVERVATGEGTVPEFLQQTVTASDDPAGYEPIGAHAAPPEAETPGEALEEVSAHTVAEDAVSIEEAAAPVVPEVPTDGASAAAPTAPVSAAPVADEVQPETPSTSPADTAEIDVEAVEAKLNDPGSTMSFEPLEPAQERIETDSSYDAGTSTQLMWGARSDVGCVRSHNEDSYLVQSPLFCVCDGMGGHAAGEVASSIAVETISKTAPNTADPARLAAAVEAANAAVIEAAVNGLGKPGMGCTATAAYIEDNTIAIAHVGDSRAYLLHEGTLIRVTRDHSYVEELVDAGEITADEARVHPNRSVITRALGSDPAMYADHFQLTIEEGDRLILCSDGLSSMIPDRDIENIATQSPTAQMCVDNLVDAALAAGGSDNVTVIAVDVVDDGRMRKVANKRKRNVLIAVVGLVAALAIALIAGFFTVSGSVYLGTHKGCVAIYTGINSTFMGIDLSHLEDETTVKISDLPQDTQNRLKDGIPQSSIDEAMGTVSKYRKQIDDEQTQQVQDAATIKNNTSAASGDTGADSDTAGDASSATAQGGTDE